MRADRIVPGSRAAQIPERSAVIRRFASGPALAPKTSSLSERRSIGSTEPKGSRPRLIRPLRWTSGVPSVMQRSGNPSARAIARCPPSCTSIDTYAALYPNNAHPIQFMLCETLSLSTSGEVLFSLAVGIVATLAGAYWGSRLQIFQHESHGRKRRCFPKLEVSRVPVRPAHTDSPLPDGNSDVT